MDSSVIMEMIIVENLNNHLIKQCMAHLEHLKINDKTKKIVSRYLEQVYYDGFHDGLKIGINEVVNTKELNID